MPGRLPRQIEADPHGPAIAALLASTARPLWSGGRVMASGVALTAPLVTALRAAARDGRLARGLEGAAAALAAEQQGLSTLARRTGAPAADRISRLVLASNDGAERFYRQLERLLVTHAPRVACLVLDVDSATLGERVYGREALTKLLLVEHKDAVAAVLRALAA